MSKENQSLIERWANIITPLLIAAIGYFIHMERMASEAHADKIVAALEQKDTEMFEPRQEHAADINKVVTWNEKMLQNIQEMRIQIQTITDRQK